MSHGPLSSPDLNFCAFLFHAAFSNTFSLSLRLCVPLAVSTQRGESATSQPVSPCGSGSCSLPTSMRPAGATARTARCSRQGGSRSRPRPTPSPRGHGSSWERPRPVPRSCREPRPSSAARRLPATRSAERRSSARAARSMLDACSSRGKTCTHALRRRQRSKRIRRFDQDPGATSLLTVSSWFAGPDNQVSLLESRRSG